MFPEGRALSKNDYLIVTGDFGLVWDGSKEEQYWRNWLSQKNWTTLFVDGNHENFDLLAGYPLEEWNDGQIHRITDSILHLCRGQVYIIDGIKLFTFGGARSTDMECRTVHRSWWPQELPTPEEYEEGLRNLERSNWEVDYVISHTGSVRNLNRLKELYNYADEITDLNRYFEDLEEKLTYRRWYFGHFHRDYQVTEQAAVVYQKVISL